MRRVSQLESEVDVRSGPLGELARTRGWIDASFLVQNHPEALWLQPSARHQGNAGRSSCCFLWALSAPTTITFPLISSSCHTRSKRVW